MIFLIEYDRRKGHLVTLRSFEDSERACATTERLELEIRRSKEGVEDEIVLLEAASIEALEKTHRRYFKTARQIVEAGIKALS